MNRRWVIASASVLLLGVNSNAVAQVLDTAPPTGTAATSATADGTPTPATRSVVVPGADGAPNGATRPTPQDSIGTDLLAVTGAADADAEDAAATDTGTDFLAAAESALNADSSPGTAASVATTDATPQARQTAPERDTTTAMTTVTTATPPADPREVMVALWRERVLAGDTELGLEQWLAAALGLSAAPESLDDSSVSESEATNATAAGTDADLEAPAALTPVDSHDARTRTVSQRWQDRAGPVALGRAGRVVTVFGSAIPTAFCSPLTVCTIELEPGEELTDAPSWGDAVRWQVVAKKQGSETVLLEVKPADDAEITNLVIPTDRRLYTIKLVNDPEVHTPILAFSYPDSLERELAAAEAAAFAEQRAQAEARAVTDRAARAAQNRELERAGIATENGTVVAAELDFGFRIDGRAPFKPVRVFADGDRTYIDLPPNYRGALPAIVAGPNETNAALNTRVAEDGTRLIADRVIADIYLQSGKQRVRVRRNES